MRTSVVLASGVVAYAGPPRIRTFRFPASGCSRHSWRILALSNLRQGHFTSKMSAWTPSMPRRNAEAVA